MASDPRKLESLVGQALNDIGAVLTGNLIVVGDKLGLFRGLAEGPATSAGLAERTGTTERYVREWCSAVAAAGYVSYDAERDRWFLTDEQTECLVDEESPACMLGGFQAMAGASRAASKLVEAFRTGEGIGWHEHDADLFLGTERFFRPGYAANLASSWIPALDGVAAKLESGATAADVGCGHGASTILLAKTYPRSRFWGFDYHRPSIEAARARAEAAGVADRVTFEVASGRDYPGRFDLVAHFDCLHDMGDPVGAARHVLESLEPDGTWMLVEPFANDDVKDNLNPIGRIFYSASTMICTPASLAQQGRAALGAQAGEKRIGEVVREAGFTRFRRATATPFNLVFEAKP
jgi:SAM-dependent methyltransferase